MRTIILPVVLALATAACAGGPHAHTARLAATADAGSTWGAIAQVGAREANPLLSGSPAGIAGVLVVKLAMVEATASLEPSQQAIALRGLSSLWAGASFNNVAVLLGGPTPLALIAGLCGALWAWHGSDEP